MSAAPQHPQEPTPDDPAPERVATELAAVLGRLSRRMRTVRQSMRQTLGALEERGLVTRTPDPSDGRKSVVSATGEGIAALAGARAVTRGWLAEAIAGELDGRERRTVAEAVALIRRLAEE
ncbi:MarR family winged helix-turn-helix transcriptional regulator [Streptomyces griseolus]|uniref:MarR family winged helix-turn-helix transcriptional regulator n=1 Tax=Streptomyces griseolus TaxID=1909 RepID=UPI002244B878|nr:MarR family transcriptional regulator [Streptomyces griseolus]MCW8221119.1 winged helix DNA-binding protein [Streptomyces griseolus]